MLNAPVAVHLETLDRFMAHGDASQDKRCRRIASPNHAWRSGLSWGRIRCDETDGHSPTIPPGAPRGTGAHSSGLPRGLGAVRPSGAVLLLTPATVAPASLPERPSAMVQCMSRLPDCGWLEFLLVAGEAFSDGTVAVDLDPLSLLCRLVALVPAPSLPHGTLLGRPWNAPERVALAAQAWG